MYGSLYSSSLISTASEPFLHLLKLWLLLLGNLGEGSPGSQEQSTPVLVLSPAPPKDLMANSAAGAENATRSGRADLREWLLWALGKLHYGLGQNGGRKKMTHYTALLIFVINAPKQYFWSPDSYKAVTLMWHFILTKAFPNISSHPSSPTQVLLQIKYLSIMISLNTYKRKLNQ